MVIKRAANISRLFAICSALCVVAFFAVARVEFSMLLYEVDEVDGAVTVCLTKNIDTAAPFTAVLQPSQSAASPPVIFPARGIL